MNCCTTNCNTIQILEPNSDLIVDTAGARSDMDELGAVALTPGQTDVQVAFLVPKFNAQYHFEYLYVSRLGGTQPGAIQVIPRSQTRQGFAVALAGTPITNNYVLHWRVVVVTTTDPTMVDEPEDRLIRLPNSSGPFLVSFVNPRSSTDYGFTELAVQNLVDAPQHQTPISIQLYSKTTINFGININPRPPIGIGGVVNYFLRMRTP